MQKNTLCKDVFIANDKCIYSIEELIEVLNLIKRLTRYAAIFNRHFFMKEFIFLFLWNKGLTS